MFKMARKHAILLLLASLITASPLTTSKRVAAVNTKRSDVTTTARNPCGRIDAALKPIPGAAKGSAYRGTVPAKLAYDCLQSIPINTTVAADFVNSLRPYLAFQSTVGYLKKPTDDYEATMFDPVDLYGGLDAIEKKLKRNWYESEYEFGMEVYELFQSAHDGHLWITPNVVSDLFTWNRPFPLVSVSEDGFEIPAIFSYNDVLEAARNPSFKPSAVKYIDDVVAEEFLLDLSEYGSLQDRDALWNSLFYSLPQISMGPNGGGPGMFAGSGRGRLVYPGPKTFIEFENGTHISIANEARVKASFKDLADGKAVYDKFFRIDQDMNIDLNSLTPAVDFEKDPRFPSTPAETKSKDNSSIPAPGYPPPVVRMHTHELGGYFLTTPGYEDVAVLSVPSFVGGELQPEFQNVSREFLTKAKEAGKKKLVIDVSANGGGTIWLGYELFAQLFPEIVPFGGNRFRANQPWDELGKWVGQVTTGIERSLDLSANMSDFVSSPMNFRSDLNAENMPFGSWQEKFGPHEYNGDTYTTTQRWNLDDPMGVLYSGLEHLTGKGLATLDLPFKAEDMVLVYDGYCASTCTIFSELMRQQGGVETIAMGGRHHEDIIQAVGGTKGTNIWPFVSVMWYVMTMYQMADDAMKKSWIGTPISKFNSFLPYHRTTGGMDVNMRDGVRQGDSSGTPLQFIYEEADCKIFYTAEMTVDQSKVWEAAADAKWFGKRDCAAGGFKSSAKKELKKRAPRTRKPVDDSTLSTFGSVPQVEERHLEKLERSTQIWTEFHRSKRADGIMIP